MIKKGEWKKRRLLRRIRLGGESQGENEEEEGKIFVLVAQKTLREEDLAGHEEEEEESE